MFSLHLLILGAMALLGLPVLAFWIWMLVDAATNESNEGNDKIIWVLIILLGHFIGAVIYYFARRPRRIAELGH